MSGLIDEDTDELVSLDMIFAEWNTNEKYLSNDLTLLRDSIVKQKDALKNEFTAYTKIPKGSGPANIFNPSKFLKHLENFKRDEYKLVQKTPENNKNSITELYSKVQAKLLNAVTEECDLRLKWLMEVKSDFHDANKVEIVDRITGFLTAIKMNPVGTGSKRQMVEHALLEFKSLDYDDAVRSVSLLEDAKIEIGLLRKIGTPNRNLVTSSRALITSLKSLYNLAENSIANETQQASRDLEHAVSVRTKIEKSIGSLSSLLTETGNLSDD